MPRANAQCPFVDGFGRRVDGLEVHLESNRPPVLARLQFSSRQGNACGQSCCHTSNLLVTHKSHLQITLYLRTVVASISYYDTRRGTKVLRYLTCLPYLTTCTRTWVGSIYLRLKVKQAPEVSVQSAAPRSFSLSRFHGALRTYRHCLFFMVMYFFSCCNCLRCGPRSGAKYGRCRLHRSTNKHNWRYARRASIRMSPP